jgi:hypothetical protein
MYFLIEGRCVSTYYLATKDLQAIFIGKKMAHEDEIIKGLLTGKKNSKESGIKQAL